MTMVCQTCYRTLSILEAQGKLKYVQGYAQCVDCGGDLEYESVVVRQIHYDRMKEGISLPQWLQDELEEGRRRVSDIFRSLHNNEPSREIKELPKESIAEKRQKDKEKEELKEEIQEARKEVKNPLENLSVGDE